MEHGACDTISRSMRADALSTGLSLSATGFIAAHFFFSFFFFALSCTSNKRQITDALRTSHRQTILIISKRETARQRNEQTDRSTINLDFIGKIYVTSFQVPFDNTQNAQITKSDFAQYSFDFAHLGVFSFSCSSTKGDKSSYFLFCFFFLFGIIVCQILPFRHKIIEDSTSY